MIMEASIYFPLESYQHEKVMDELILFPAYIISKSLSLSSCQHIANIQYNFCPTIIPAALGSLAGTLCNLFHTILQKLNHITPNTIDKLVDSNLMSIPYNYKVIKFKFISLYGKIIESLSITFWHSGGTPTSLRRTVSENKAESWRTEADSR